MQKRRVYSCNFNRSAYLPLVWGSLLAYLQTQPDLLEHYHFEQPFFLPEQLPTALEQVADPSVFAVSCYLWNIRKSLRLAEQVKQRWPAATVIAGGPHIPESGIEDFLAEHPYVDFVIRKEGEVPFAALLRELTRAEPDFAAVPSLTWREPGGTVRRNPLGGQLPNETDVPSPWLTEVLEPAMDTARAHGYQPIALWETNRGCPYSCTFCDWGSATLSKVRRFPEDRLHEEIDYFSARDVAAVMCCDANFGILPRDVGLAKHLVDNRSRFGSPTKFVTSWAKSSPDRVFEISRMFVRSGMSNGTILSMQTGSADVLAQVKRSNMRAENYESMARKFHDAGIEAYTEVILGLPHETPESFVDGLCRMLRMGIHDDIMIYECAVLPNAELGTPESRAKYALDTIERTYLPGDVERIEVVVGHSMMTRDDWVRMYLFGAVVQSMHNSGLTRYLATYLDTENIVPYQDFYRFLLDDALARKETVLGAALDRAERLLRDYLASATVPNEGKVLSQPDMRAELAELVPGKREWLIYEWCWAKAQAEMDRFYAELVHTLHRMGVEIDPTVDDLLRFQNASVFTLADGGDSVRADLFAHNWISYFADPSAGLRPEHALLRFEPTLARLR